MLFLILHHQQLNTTKFNIYFSLLDNKTPIKFLHLQSVSYSFLYPFSILALVTHSIVSDRVLVIVPWMDLTVPIKAFCKGKNIIKKKREGTR